MSPSTVVQWMVLATALFGSLLSFTPARAEVDAWDTIDDASASRREMKPEATRDDDSNWRERMRARIERRQERRVDRRADRRSRRQGEVEEEAGRKLPLEVHVAERSERRAASGSGWCPCLRSLLAWNWGDH